MSRNQLSPRDVVNLTSRIVAAFCTANRTTAHELPTLIVAVGQKLDDLNAMPALESGGADTSRAASAHRPFHQGGPQSRPGSCQFEERLGRGTGASAALGMRRRLTTSELKARPINPNAVAAVSSAYQDAMTEVVRRSGYLPSKLGREIMAEKMIVAADSGERDPTRLKQAGLPVPRDDNVAPLSLGFAARLRRLQPEP
jgi:hypothetical protein